MSANTRRPSGVAGLEIVGVYKGYELIWRAPGGEKSLTLYPWSPDFAPSRFATIKEAKAAARRLADLFPWDSADLPAVVAEAAKVDREAVRRAIVERLTGRTIEEIEAEYQAQAEERARQREERNAWCRGESPKEAMEELATENGHEIDWRKSGQRSYRGKCRRCKLEFRSSYVSVSGSYRRVGPYDRTCEGAA